MHCRTLLFESSGKRSLDLATELLISNLIYVFLLFECHGYVVSSSGVKGQRLGIQDGFIYFIHHEDNGFSAKQILGKFESNPLMSPGWVTGESRGGL